MRLTQWRKTVDEKLRAYSIAKDTAEVETQLLAEKKQQLAAYDEAKQIAQAVAQQVQTTVYERIAVVVSKCLESVFDEPYQLRMNFVQRRGRTEVELSFIRGGLEVDPLTASGGGVVDVASFALRLASLMMSRPPLRRILVLDEPFRFVSEEYRDGIRSMLETLASEMDVQIIMVTHIQELRTGKVIEL